MSVTGKNVHYEGIRDGNTGRIPLTRYGAALIAVALASLVRFAASPLFGWEFPFLLFAFAVFFSADFGGKGPGFTATALSIIVVGAAFIQPRSNFIPGHIADAARMALFAVLGVVISLAVNRLKRANRDLLCSAQELEQSNASLQSSERELLQANELLRRSQQSLTYANARLEISNGDLQKFAYSVSHDLQAPIRTIGAFSQLLIQKYEAKLDADGCELLAHIAAAVVRMNALVRDLLEYSKVTHVEADSITATDCNEVLRGVLQDCAASVHETGAQVTADTLPIVQADPKRLAQVFLNLIENGLKYRSAQPPKLHISAKSEDEHWQFSVTDNGIGFDMAHAERIFTAFERLHSTGSSYQGSGIGLSIVKRIVERQGGTVWAVSRQGIGSTFYFTVPSKPEPHPKQLSASSV